MNELSERFNRLTAREKIACIIMLATVSWGAWDNFFYQPITSHKNQLESDLSSLTSQLSEQQQILSQIKTLGNIDPNKTNKQKLSQLEADLKTLKAQLGIGDKAFVSAHLMVEVLNDMLNKNSKLRLVKLESLPVSPLSKTGQEGSGVYKHGLSITLRGTYIDTFNYLVSLEILPWKFSWSKIKYLVNEYPIAESTIDVYTLSFEENWLGL